MRILIYALNYAPEPVGSGKYTAELAEWMAVRGHDVSVICGLPHYPAWQLHSAYADGRSRVELRAGVKVFRAAHYVPTHGRLSVRQRIRLETTFTVSAGRYWLRWIFARQKPDAVIAVMPPMQVGVWPLLYAWLRRVPWIMHVQDLQVDAALRLGMLKGRRIGAALYRVERYLLRHATRVSTITRAMQARIAAKGVRGAWIWLLPNWSDLETIHPGDTDNDFRRTNHLPPEVTLVLYAGSMGEKQGLEAVIAAAQATRDDDGLRFLMVGDGSARHRLEQMARSFGLCNLDFLPLQPRERLNEMLAAADIHLVVQKRTAADLVMPSKLTNILAAGRCCVVTADAGTELAELVRAHEVGLVVPPEDVSALAEAIRRLASNSRLRGQMGNNARRYAERHLDRDVICKRFETRLTTMIKYG